MKRLIFTALSCLACYGATYHVAVTGDDETGNGSLGSPYRTVNKGYTQAGYGDTVSVGYGVYTNEALAVRKSGLTFIGSGYPSVGQFYIRTNSNITIGGFELTAPGGLNIPGGYVTVSGMCTNIAILSNRIHGVLAYVNGIQSKEDSSANSSNIVYHPDSITIRGNTLYDLGEVAVSLLGKNHVVENNTITNIVDKDVFQIFGTNHVLRSNLITGVTRSGSAHVDVFQSFANGLSSSAYGDIVFEANIVTNCPGTQLFNIESYSYGYYSNFTFRNNLYAAVGFAGNMYAPGLVFENNTCWRTTTNTAGPVLLRLSATGKGRADNAIIRNNLFIECGSNPSSTSMGWYSVDTGLTNIVADYNMVAGPGGAAKGGSFAETHGINGGDVLFVSTNDWNFRLQAASPAVNAGTALSDSFTTDLLGFARDSSWDIGAYEYAVQTTNRVRPMKLNRLRKLD